MDNPLLPTADPVLAVVADIYEWAVARKYALLPRLLPEQLDEMLDRLVAEVDGSVPDLRACAEDIIRRREQGKTLVEVFGGED